MIGEIKSGYLKTQNKEECFGCEACVGICVHHAISMKEDEEGFRYPTIAESNCVRCGLCQSICPQNRIPVKNPASPLVFGGHIKDGRVREESTSGGIFTAIANTWSKDGNYVIFGAYSKGLEVYHGFSCEINEIGQFRKSKYSQSSIGTTYQDVIKFLNEGKRVLFSGTPCQIAALGNILGNQFQSENLLTVEVVCEGFPSPIFLRKYILFLEKKYKAKVVTLDYRFKNKNKWDYECMRICFDNKRELVRDRWFSPFWIFWSRRLMSRPSCIKCMFRTPERVADITLGDLWGVHKYCPDLYDGNKGATLVVCNSDKGKMWFKRCSPLIEGHELIFEEALEYQRPMRTIVPANPYRDQFMNDLRLMDYEEVCKKWKGCESLGLLRKKYILGSNRQVVAWYNLKKKIKSIFVQ